MPAVEPRSCVHRETGLATRFRQGLEEIMPVHVRLKNVPLAVGPTPHTCRADPP